MVRWLARHFLLIFFAIFILAGFFFRDELFGDQAMRALLALLEQQETPRTVVPVLEVALAPVVTVDPPSHTQAEQAIVVAKSYQLNEPRYSFRPLQEDVATKVHSVAAQTLQIEPSAALISDNISAPEQLSVPSALPVLNAQETTVQDDAIIREVPTQPLVIPQPPIITQPPDLTPSSQSTQDDDASRTMHQPFTYTPALDRALQEDYLRQRMRERMSQGKSFIPHSYTVQPPELLRSPAANFPEAEAILQPEALQRKDTVPKNAAVEDMLASPLAMPDVLPRQQTLSYELIDPHRHYTRHATSYLSGIEARRAQAETAQMGAALNTARSAFWRKDYPRAEQAYRELMQRFPQSGSLFGELGNVYYYQGLSEKAAIAYSQSIVRLVQQNKMQHARFTLDVLWRLDPNRARLLVEQLPSLARR